MLSVFEAALEFAKQKSTTYEIIIVNDGSTDSTNAICADIKKQFPTTKVIKHNINQGIGMALKSGYENATMEYVCAIPADNQFDINELNMIQPFSNSTYYSFYRPETNYNIYRATLNWGNRFFNQHILGIYLRDVNWIKVYRKQQLEWVKPVLKSSLIESEICAKLNKENVLPIEIPSKYLKRIGGSAKGGSWHTLKKVILEVIKLWWITFQYKKQGI